MKDMTKLGKDDKLLLFGILIALFVWTFYQVLNQAITDLLMKINITGFYPSSLTILIVVGIILISQKKGIRKLLVR